MDIDHVVLWVDDPKTALQFYADVIGLEPVRAEAFDLGNAPFPSIRVNTTTIIDLMARSAASDVEAFTGGAGSESAHPINHLCLSIDATEYSALAQRLNEQGVELTAGGTQSFGARGSAKISTYFRDPDGNVIEIRHY
jgi:glyoxylase I family protein